MNALMNAVRDALAQNGLWRDGARLLCAVSGGCDSVAILHALCRLRSQRAIQVFAVHVQHGLRGADSQADESFVRKLCESLNVPLTVENARLTGDMRTPGMETMARERRRQIFSHRVQALHADALLLAHHRDDQAETVLMHLFRGSGMQGLCGMQTAAPFAGALVIRPFLNLSKQQIRDALADAPFREDQSNQEALTPRNALRLQVIPQLEALFPGAGAHIAQLSEILFADEAALSGQADALYQQAFYAAPPLFMLSVPALMQAPQAIRRRALRRWYLDGLSKAGLQPDERSLSYDDTLALCGLLDGPAGGRVNLPCHLMAARETDWLHLLVQSGEPLESIRPFETAVQADVRRYDLPHLTVQAIPPHALPQDARSILLAQEWLAMRPVFRLPQPQDVIRPFGAPGHKPLRRFLTDRKTDPFLRRAWPVLCIGHEVLWIPGLCAAEHLRLSQVPADGIQLIITGQQPFLPNSPKE